LTISQIEILTIVMIRFAVGDVGL